MAHVAIVTGAASGIGFALARALAHQGKHVVLADRNADALSAAADALRQEAGSAEPVVVDVSDAAAVAETIEATHAQHGRLDMLFNNAGIPMGGEPEDLTLAHWERTIDVNLRGVLHGCHAAYPLMKRQGFGHIVNTASLAGLGPGLGTIAPYNTTKHAVVGLSSSLRAAAADFGVRVHVVCPGLINTSILDSVGEPDVTAPPGTTGVDARAVMADLGMKHAYSADRCAADILRGVARNRPVIVVPRQARIAWLMLRLSPALADILALRATRIARKHTAAARRRSAAEAGIVPP